MIWNVFRRDMTTNKIETYNIFRHSRFYNDIVELKKKKLPKVEFERELHSALMYSFWSKFEMETVVTSWPPYIDSDELDRLNYENTRSYNEHGKPYVRQAVNLVSSIKIDIYDQVELNWDSFVDYVYNAEIVKREVDS